MELADCVDETVLPVWMRRLTESAEGIAADTASLLSALVVLAVEMGFVPASDQTEYPKSAPVGYSYPVLSRLAALRLSNLYSTGTSHIVTLSLPSCDHTLDLVVSPLGDLFIINFHVPCECESWALTLSLKNYFSNDGVPKFDKLPELSLRFKNICSFARNEILDLSGRAEYNITGLPYEILCLICTYLNAESFVKLSATCKKLNVLYYDKQLWKRWHKIVFPNDSEPDNSYEREKFIEKYKRKQRRARRPFPPVPHPYNPFMNPYYLSACYSRHRINNNNNPVFFHDPFA